MIGDVHHATHAELAARIVASGAHVDALIVDPPYSARTHAGHDSLATLRRELGYAPWTERDVAEFVEVWSEITRGWVVVMTDCDLAQVWRDALASKGRTAFAPVPLVELNSRVRLMGDGPSSWTTWVVVARPRSLVRWGTLPGAYVVPVERGRQVIGGKPLAAMRAIVTDYSLPGDVVCDPCCGAGTTLLAASLLGRKWVGGDARQSCVDIARRRLDGARKQTTLDVRIETRAEQLRLEAAR